MAPLHASAVSTASTATSPLTISSSTPSSIPSSIPSSTTTRPLRSAMARLDDNVLQYSSFPHAQSPPPPSTASSASHASHASTTSTSTALPPPRSFPFSHDDTERSRTAYETLAARAKAYRVAMGHLSAAASDFGAALEACARLKEARSQPYPPPYRSSSRASVAGTLDGSLSLYEDLGVASLPSCTADVLLATAGLYYLVANQQGILAETVYRAFELPMVHELDRYKADMEAEQEAYAAGMREASREIRRLEKEGGQLRRPRQRDVGRMRSHLVAMTGALDALTARQHDHAVALLDQSRDMSGVVSQAGRNLVRAEMDILDALARKGWPGGGLDVVLDGAVDLFRNDDDGGESGDGYLYGDGDRTGAGTYRDKSAQGGPVVSAAASASADFSLGLGPRLQPLGGAVSSRGALGDGDLEDDPFSPKMNGGSNNDDNDIDNDDDDDDDGDDGDDDTISERQPRSRAVSAEKKELLAKSPPLPSPPPPATEHAYQSLDSVMVPAERAPSSSKANTSRIPQSRARSVRPFSPQRVAVDLHRDVIPADASDALADKVPEREPGTSTPDPGAQTPSSEETDAEPDEEWKTGTRSVPSADEGVQAWQET